MELDKGEETFFVKIALLPLYELVTESSPSTSSERRKERQLEREYGARVQKSQEILLTVSLYLGTIPIVDGRKPRERKE